MTNHVEKLIEVKLTAPENFLKVKETLTRIGIASRKNKTLTQTCHILHKRGLYYVVHFLEMFLLDGKTANFTEEDMARRNTIINLLEEWELIEVVDPSKTENPVVSLSKIMVLPFSQKKDWQLVSKYQIGSRK